MPCTQLLEELSDLRLRREVPGVVVIRDGDLAGAERGQRRRCRRRKRGSRRIASTEPRKAQERHRRPKEQHRRAECQRGLHQTACRARRVGGMPAPAATVVCALPSAVAGDHFG